MMPSVSITRLRIRSLRFLPLFLLQTQQTLTQVRSADGFLGGALLGERRMTFWTATAWREMEDMRRYITSGAHLKVMPKLMDWCDEASVVHWAQDTDALPPWSVAEQRMRNEGRPSKVRRPSPDHQALTFRAPRTTGAVPITPRPGPN